MSRANSYERKGAVDSTEVPIQKAEQTFSIDDTVKGNLLGAEGIVTEPVYANELLEDEKFMSMPVEVMLHEPTNENEPQFAEVTVNGMYRLIPRSGNPVTIPRMHLAVLCDAKVQRVSQRRVTGSDGELGFQEIIRTNLAYPFSVIHDPAGQRGANWLKQKLSAPI